MLRESTPRPWSIAAPVGVFFNFVASVDLVGVGQRLQDGAQVFQGPFLYPGAVREVVLGEIARYEAAVAAPEPVAQLDGYQRVDEGGQSHYTSRDYHKRRHNSHFFERKIRTQQRGNFCQSTRCFFIVYFWLGFSFYQDYQKQQK